MRSILILVMLSITTFLSAQSQPALEEAFESSYAYEAVANYKKASAVLEKVYDAGSYPLNLRLGWLQYNLGNYQKSKEYYQKAVELMPYSLEAKVGLTYPVSAMGNTNELEVLYQDILAINKNHTTARYNVALIYYNRKEYQAAFDMLEKVVNQYPFDYDSNVLFAWINFQMGNAREAKVLFQRVLLMEPGDESATQGLKLME